MCKSIRSPFGLGFLSGGTPGSSNGSTCRYRRDKSENVNFFTMGRRHRVVLASSDSSHWNSIGESSGPTEFGTSAAHTGSRDSLKRWYRGDELASVECLTIGQ